MKYTTTEEGQRAMKEMMEYTKKIRKINASIQFEPDFDGVNHMPLWKISKALQVVEDEIHEFEQEIEKEIQRNKEKKEKEDT